ncbi:MAG: M1 family metallopeptidase [Anaerolineae bacterium]
MRYLTLALFLLLAACNTVTLTPTPGNATSTPRYILRTPTLSDDLPFLITQTPTHTPASTPSPAETAPAVPTLSGQAGPYAADLRPEFQNDVGLVPSPTLYRMDLQLSPALDRLTGTEAVTYTNRTGQPLSEIYFRLFANYPDGGDKISIDSLQVNQAPAQKTLEVQDTALKVALPQSLAPGQSARLDLTWNVTIPISHTEHYADFTNSDGIVTLPSVYPLIPAYDTQGWHIELPPAYGDLVYADDSFYDVRITAPTTTTVIASGTAVQTLTQGDQTTYYYIGAPMRDFSIDASTTLRKASTQVGDITINSYYLPQDEAIGQNVLNWSAAALDLYQKRIGPYPFKELDVLETPTTAGGIEYPGLVALAEDLYRNPQQRNYLEFADIHEVAHQWFYSNVGDDQVNTPWMDESFVQYVSYIYEQQTYGQQTADFIKQSVFQRPWDDAKKQGQDKPIGLPVMSYSEREYVAFVYGKGPLFFDTVRQQIGDDKFFQFLQTYYSRYRYKVAHPDDMLKTMNEVSGQDLTALFNQWVYGK